LAQIHAFGVKIRGVAQSQLSGLAAPMQAPAICLLGNNRKHNASHKAAVHIPIGVCDCSRGTSSHIQEQAVCRECSRAACGTESFQRTNRGWVFSNMQAGLLSGTFSKLRGSMLFWRACTCKHVPQLPGHAASQLLRVHIPKGYVALAVSTSSAQSYCLLESTRGSRTKVVWVQHSEPCQLELLSMGTNQGA